MEGMASPQSRKFVSGPTEAIFWSAQSTFLKVNAQFSLACASVVVFGRLIAPLHSDSFAVSRGNGKHEATLPQNCEVCYKESLWQLSVLNLCP